MSNNIAYITKTTQKLRRQLYKMRENDELHVPLPENIQLHELQRRYPARRRTQRQQADFLNWDDVPPQLLHN